jgi:probable phosphoglycerate mutase
MVSVLTEATDTLGVGETGVLVGHGASLRTGLVAFFGVPEQLREMLAGMANCAWAVLEQHHNRGWQIIDYNAQTLPEPLELADDLDSP